MLVNGVENAARARMINVRNQVNQAWSARITNPGCEGRGGKIEKSEESNQRKIETKSEIQEV